MNEKDKQLLLKDLSARLPYGVKVHYGYNEYDLYSIDMNNVIIVRPFMSNLEVHPIETIKSYLRPMSNMTEEEQKEFYDFCVIDEEAWMGNGIKGCINQSEIMSNGIDWLNANHFDYRGLIEKGLAIEAPVNMYNFKNN